MEPADVCAETHPGRRSAVVAGYRCGPRVRQPPPSGRVGGLLCKPLLPPRGQAPLLLLHRRLRLLLPLPLPPLVGGEGSRSARRWWSVDLGMGATAARTRSSRSISALRRFHSSNAASRSSWLACGRLCEPLPSSSLPSCRRRLRRSSSFLRRHSFQLASPASRRFRCSRSYSSCSCSSARRTAGLCRSTLGERRPRQTPPEPQQRAENSCSKAAGRKGCPAATEGAARRLATHSGIRPVGVRPMWQLRMRWSSVLARSSASWRVGGVRGAVSVGKADAAGTGSCRDRTVTASVRCRVASGLREAGVRNAGCAAGAPARPRAAPGAGAAAQIKDAPVLLARLAGWDEEGLEPLVPGLLGRALLRRGQCAPGRRHRGQVAAGRPMGEQARRPFSTRPTLASAGRARDAGGAANRARRVPCGRQPVACDNDRHVLCGACRVQNGGAARVRQPGHRGPPPWRVGSTSGPYALVTRRYAHAGATPGRGQDENVAASVSRSADAQTKVDAESSFTVRRTASMSALARRRLPRHRADAPGGAGRVGGGHSLAFRRPAVPHERGDHVFQQGVCRGRLAGGHSRGNGDQGA